MPTSPSQDDTLLARLNALKRSTVSFDTTPIYSINRSSPSAPSANSTTSTTPNAADTLAARFARLGSASPSPSPKASRTTSTTENQVNGGGAPVIAPGAPSYLEGVAEGLGSDGDGTQFNEEDERSLEELLRELGDRGDWDIKRSEAQDVGKMLREVRGILPDVQGPRKREEEERVNNKGRKEGEELTDWENVEVDVGSGGVTVQGKEQDEEDSEDGEAEKKPTEDEEADDVIARIMAELSIEKKYDAPLQDDEVDHSDAGDHKSGSRETRPTAELAFKDDSEDDEGGISLPSAPTSLPEPPKDSLDATQTFEDRLAARFASLSSPSPLSKPATDSLGLPSAPSFHPSAKPPKITSTVKHTDEEIDTWCVICNDDATLKCLGCDNDLYCQNCWMEGHRGPDAGFEEKRHKAVLYSKKKKQTAAAA